MYTRRHFFVGLRVYSSVVKQANHVKRTNINNLRKDVLEYRHVYPEFLPDPNIEFRNTLREKLERNDMLARRSHINIPEFYVGKFHIKLIKLLFVRITTVKNVVHL